MQPPPSSNRKNYQIISHLRLRTAIGALGILLPFVLVIVDSIDIGHFHIEFSISDYYDNNIAGDLLVGVLFVLGFFLWAYRGYEPVDDWVSNSGFFFALGVALFPTTSKIAFVHKMHFVFALLLFTSFIVFSLYLFRKKPKDEDKVTEKKETRNKAYLVCGIIMIVCIIMIALGSFGLLGKATSEYKLVFWFETIGLVAFGFSWITKGELLWADANSFDEEEKK